MGRTAMTIQDIEQGFKSIPNGFHIGSGAMESANKYISHTRMKRSGAWWQVPSGNAMLRIRCAMYNGTFQQVFERYTRGNS